MTTYLFRRNLEVRSQAEYERGVLKSRMCKLDEPVCAFKAPFGPRLVHFHPYNAQLAVAGPKQITIRHLRHQDHALSHRRAEGEEAFGRAVLGARLCQCARARVAYGGVGRRGHQSLQVNKSCKTKQIHFLNILCSGIKRMSSTRMAPTKSSW